MPCPSRKMVIKMKIWVEDEAGQMVFGPGRMNILEAVGKHGSILAAAKELGMSYRAVWGKIKASEECLGRALVIKHIGGHRSGGSELTVFGKTLVENFWRLQTAIRETSEALFQGLFVDEIDEIFVDSSGDSQ
jgi:molybdate transport system regulatory protein